jgi:hypothetical protein
MVSVASSVDLESLPAADPVPDAAEALVDECRAMAERVRAGRRRAEQLRALAEHAEAQASRDEQILAELEAALGMAPQLRIEDLDRRLGGQRLEEIAIDLLRRERQFGEAIHYREWFALIERAGHQVGGRDPHATFLAQLRRSERVEAVGRRSGRYRLRVA